MASENLYPASDLGWEGASVIGPGRLSASRLGEPCIYRDPSPLCPRLSRAGMFGSEAMTSSEGAAWLSRFLPLARMPTPTK
eukprot:6481012-Amphidinium_carterae.1